MHTQGALTTQENNMKLNAQYSRNNTTHTHTHRASTEAHKMAKSSPNRARADTGWSSTSSSVRWLCCVLLLGLGCLSTAHVRLTQAHTHNILTHTLTHTHSSKETEAASTSVSIVGWSAQEYQNTTPTV